MLWTAHSDLSVLEQRILKRATRWISYRKATQHISGLKDTKSNCEKRVKIDECVRSVHAPTHLACFMHIWNTNFCEHLITDSYHNPSVFCCLELQFSDVTHDEYPKYPLMKQDRWGNGKPSRKCDLTSHTKFVDPTRPHNVLGNYFSKCFFCCRGFMRSRKWMLATQWSLH